MKPVDVKIATNVGGAARPDRKAAVDTGQKKVPSGEPAAGSPVETVDIKSTPAPRELVTERTVENTPVPRTETPREEAAPTTLIQLDGAPVTDVAEAGPLTETQLVTGALESYGKADAHLQTVQNTIGSLQPEHQKEVGKSMFYATASLMGEFQADTPDGGKRPMMSGEIRQEVAGWPEPQRKALEKRVQDFSKDDPSSAMLGMATGAAEWGQSRWDALMADENSGKPVNEADKVNAGTLYLSGIGYGEETGKFAESVNGLLAQGKQELAQRVIDSTLNA